MNINQTLNDDCFVAIFAQLEPSDLLLVRGVCLLWRHFSEMVCRTKTTLSIGNHEDYPVDKLEFYGFDCAKPHTSKTMDNFDLVLKYGITKIKTEKDDDEWFRYEEKANADKIRRKHGIGVSGLFQLKLMTEQDGTRFAELFPKLTSLAITNYERESTDILVAMLSHWPLLTNLKIIGRFDWPLLRDTIGHLAQLRHLSISVCVRKLSQLANVDQLHEFYCKRGLCAKEHDRKWSPTRTDPEAILNQIVTEPGTVQRFGLYGFFDSVNFFNKWTSAVASRLVKLGQFDVHEFTRGSLELLARKCPSIEYVDVRSHIYGPNFIGQLNSFKSVLVFKFKFWSGFGISKLSDVIDITYNEAAQDVELLSNFVPHLAGPVLRQLFPAATKMAYRVYTRWLIPTDAEAEPSEVYDDDEEEDAPCVPCDDADCVNCCYVKTVAAALDRSMVDYAQQTRFHLDRDGLIRGHKFVLF